MTELNAVISRLKDSLTETLHKQEGIRVDAMDVEKVVNRGFSSVVFINAKTSAGERRMVAKKTVHHPANISITSTQNQSVVEFNILSELYPKFQSVPHCSVPKPILVIPEDEVFVMEFVAGKLLMEEFVAARYFASRESFLKLKQSYYQCGQWLKFFQQFTGVHPTGKEAFNSTIDRCEQKLKVIEQSKDSRCPKNFSMRIRDLIESQLSMLSGDVLVTGRHSDFGNWNILVDPEGVTVFDFLGHQPDLFPIDATKMLTNIEDEKSYLLYSKSKLQELQDGFMLGYGELPTIQRPVLIICEILHRVCCVCARIENPSNSTRRRIEQGISFKSNLDWLMNDARVPLWPIGKIS
jgi:hypothetical protein